MHCGRIWLSSRLWQRKDAKGLTIIADESDERREQATAEHGIGLIGASAIAATVTDPKAFRSGRDFAAWYLRPVPSFVL